MFVLGILLDIFVFVVGLRLINVLIKSIGVVLDRWDKRIARKITGRDYFRENNKSFWDKL